MVFLLKKRKKKKNFRCMYILTEQQQCILNKLLWHQKLLLNTNTNFYTTAWESCKKYLPVDTFMDTPTILGKLCFKLTFIQHINELLIWGYLSLLFNLYKILYSFISLWFHGLTYRCVSGRAASDDWTFWSLADRSHTCRGGPHCQPRLGTG